MKVWFLYNILFTTLNSVLLFPYVVFILIQQRQWYFKHNYFDFEHGIMKTKPVLIHSRSQHILYLLAACMFLLNNGSIGVLGISFVLKGASSFTMHLIEYHRDPPEEPHHQVEPIPKKRPTDQQQNLPCQSTYIFLYDITLVETDQFCKNTLILIRK